jgi:hypothetical protein
MDCGRRGGFEVPAREEEELLAIVAARTGEVTEGAMATV